MSMKPYLKIEVKAETNFHEFSRKLLWKLVTKFEISENPVKKS